MHLQRPRTQMAWTSHLAHLSTRNYKRNVWPNKDAIFRQNKAKDHNDVFILFILLIILLGFIVAVLIVFLIFLRNDLL